MFLLIWLLYILLFKNNLFIWVNCFCLLFFWDNWFRFWLIWLRIYFSSLLFNNNWFCLAFNLILTYLFYLNFLFWDNWLGFWFFWDNWFRFWLILIGYLSYLDSMHYFFGLTYYWLLTLIWYNYFFSIWMTNLSILLMNLLITNFNRLGLRRVNMRFSVRLLTNARVLLLRLGRGLRKGCRPQ